RAQPRRAGNARGARGEGPSVRRLIIDCHGHYTTAPAAHAAFRRAQLAGLAEPPPAQIGDHEIRESVESNQLRLQRERGVDFTIFSPQASSMEHHVPDPATAGAWARACNDLIARVVGLFPEHFAGACQLPQTPGGALDDSIAELRRCVEELGFVGLNLNPDPSGGHWTSKPLTDEYWYPLYEAMLRLDVPARAPVQAS